MTSENKPNSIYDKLILVLRGFYKDLIKNKGVFILSFVVVTGALLLLNGIKSSTYKASFTVVYEELVRKVYGDRLYKLDKLLERNKEKAYVLLNVDKKVGNTLKSIESTNILGEDLSKDLNVDKIPFIVNVYITDSSYLAEIQDAIIYYLENSNKYLQDKRTLKFKEIDAELDYINTQLDLMDSLKRKNNKSTGTTTTTAAATTDGGSVYEVSYELYKKKQELMKKKEMPLNLYVIDDAIVSVKTSKSIILVIGIGFILSMIIYAGVVYLLIPIFRKEVK